MNKSRREYVEVLSSGKFSAAWYLAQYPDVAAAQIDPVEHYLRHGVREGRDPGPDFSTSSYLARYREEIAGSGLTPLFHYLRHGRHAGYDPSPLAAQRSYRNFQEFLQYSLLFPTMTAPFSTVAEDCFAAMAETAQELFQHVDRISAPPLVTVIMPMLNRATVVGAAIQSVLDQSYRNFELIVIDDGSRDESAEVVRSFADPRIHLLENSQRMGVSFARNRGLASAKGELIAYLDSDNSWRTGYLKAMAGAFQALPDAGAVYSGQYLYKGDHRQPFAMRFASFNRSLLNNINYIDINCFMHRRSVLDHLDNWFCEELPRFEDWDFVVKVAKGNCVYSVPVLQSNYYFDKAAVTISNTESMEGPLALVKRKIEAVTPAVAVDHTPVNVCIVAINSFVGRREHAYNESLVTAATLSSTKISIVNHAGSSLRGGLRGLLTLRAESGDSMDRRPVAQAVNQKFTTSFADNDLLLLGNGAVPAPNAVRLLQECAYSSDAIAVVTPQQILDSGNSEIVAHIPEAHVSFSCDVALSYLYERIRPLPLFHCGQVVELESAPATCLYIKRQVWDRFGGFKDNSGGLQENLDSFFDFIINTLKMKIVYSPAPAVYLKHFQQEYWLSR